jgi:hypothetical protein
MNTNFIYEVVEKQKTRTAPVDNTLTYSMIIFLNILIGLEKIAEYIQKKNS